MSVGSLPGHQMLLPSKLRHGMAPIGKREGSSCQISIYPVQIELQDTSIKFTA